jgi:NADPH2:quinone reductase
MAAIQLAKSFGAKVITTVGSDEKIEFVKALGADVAINRKKENIAEVMSDTPVDIAMDCVAGNNLGECLKTMAHGGRWIVIATLGGSKAELDMNDFFRRGVKLVGSTLRSRTSEMKTEILTSLEEKLWPAFKSKKIKIITHKVLPITQAETAHKILQDNKNIGKVILKVRQ